MPKIKLESRQFKEVVNIEVSEEMIIREILETLKNDGNLNIDFSKTKVYLKLQKRYLDIESKLDEENIVDNEILVIGE